MLLSKNRVIGNDHAMDWRLGEGGVHWTLTFHNDPEFPNLVIHAVTGGFRPQQPDLAPETWFSWFLEENDRSERAKFVGLFVPPLVPSSKMYQDIRGLQEVAESFALREEIDIIVTSLGTADDGFFADSGGEVNEMAGDVLFCPYSASGTLDEKALARKPFTLFDISDMVNDVSRGKKIILVCGPSHTTNKLKTTALLPLLRNPKLRVFSDLILDIETAKDLLNH